jgi:adenosine deaminase
LQLHAHLSGSVKESTVIALLEDEHRRKLESKESLKEAVAKEMQTFKLGDRNLEECFEVFTILHRLLDNAATVERVAKGALTAWSS